MLICGYLLLSCYCAVLISYLTVETFNMPFVNIDGLIESSYELAMPKSANLQFLEDAPTDSCKCSCAYYMYIEYSDMSTFSVYHRLYIKKYVQQRSLSNELQSFISQSEGYDFPAITQKFILERSETAMFMQVLFWLPW